MIRDDGDEGGVDGVAVDPVRKGKEGGGERMKGRRR